ncbi:hypothetical protein Ae505Ps2_4039c [Pseudonocardia sp. Ae505_Ps2]|nr:hypothetical protein Ae505Ps2_4039c [Pseudonocardia sp. Ae505_Ps2]
MRQEPEPSGQHHPCVERHSPDDSDPLPPPGAPAPDRVARPPGATPDAARTSPTVGTLVAIREECPQHGLGRGRAERTEVFSVAG